MDKKLYTITTEEVVVTDRFTEAEIEGIRNRFHGYVNIFEQPELDYSAIARDLSKENK